MLGDATRLVEPSLEESAAGRRLRNRLRRLSQSLDSGSADARCRALNASLRSFARLERSPGATRELNALALVLDLTALALLDSMPPAAAALNPSRSNSQGGAR